ncbi:MAG TPA: trypsin-like peptidase domain-containing protein [Longimicrobiales bacterium]|nr:trypsin-like peptidase domain-containing protein [Longimicrobiales bacterium]
MIAFLAAGALSACTSQGAAVAGAAEADADAGPGPLASLSQVPPATAPTPGQQSAQVDASRRTAIVQAAAQVAPAVVNVSVIGREQARPESLWESFFMPPGTQRRAMGFGSGVIVRADGVILTNDHVVRNAEQIRVTLPDGRDFEAQLVGTDQVADIAVLRIRGADLPVAPVGTAEGLLIGEWAVAIGNPFANYFADAEPTVTAGVVSAVGRNIVPSSEEDGFYLGMIQTDASINPGNSGGPLVNATGQVIGINASIFSRSGGSEGTGFAIPIDRALRIADDLLAHGEVRRAWVGVDVEPVEADAWGRTRGVRVSRVAPGSPGDQAAMDVGDRLLAANGRALNTPLDFEAVMLDLRAGDALELSLEGQTRPVRMRAAALPSVTAERVTVLRDMQLITVTPQVRAERGITSEDGALIASISAELAGQLGLLQGDVLVQVNRARVRSAEDAARIFEGLRGQGTVRIYVERNGGYVARDLYWRR